MNKWKACKNNEEKIAMLKSFGILSDDQVAAVSGGNGHFECPYMVRGEDIACDDCDLKEECPYYIGGWGGSCDW